MKIWKLQFLAIWVFMILIGSPLIINGIVNGYVSYDFVGLGIIYGWIPAAIVTAFIQA